MKSNLTMVAYLSVVALLVAGVYFGLDGLEKRSFPLEYVGGKEHKVGSFVLTNQEGEVFDSEDHKDKIWVVHYFFTSCPTICPEMMRVMQSVHNIVRNEEDVLLLSITVDPKRDEPERLKTYMTRFNYDPLSWQQLTGAKSDLYGLARRDFLISATEGPGDDSDFIHSENMVVIDPQSRIRAVVNGTSAQADRDILAAIKKIRKTKT